MAADTPLGRKVKPIYDAGRLVPDELTIDLIRDRLSQPDAHNGFILDGFPRNLPQADALDDLLVELVRPLDVVFDFQIDDELAQASGCSDVRRRRPARTTPPRRSPNGSRIYHEQTEPLVQHYCPRVG